MTCTACNGTGQVMAKHGGIGLVDGNWKTYSGPVTCWHCQGAGHVPSKGGQVMTSGEGDPGWTPLR